MNNRDILIFFGAGASKAADERFPLVTEFFSKAAQLADAEPRRATGQTRNSEFDPLWRFLFKVETKGLWDANNRLPGYIPTINGIKHQCSKNPKAFEEMMRQSLSSTNSLNLGHAHTNIENIVQRIETLGFKSGANRTRRTLIEFMVWLLFNIEKSASIDYAKTPHAKLIKALDERGLLKRTILVSFNYDLVLERSIRALDRPNRPLWNSIVGCGHVWPGYYSMEKGRIIRERTTRVVDDKLVLLKPHGSLAWLRDDNNVFPIVEDRGEFGGRPTVPISNEELQSLFSNRAWEPVIIAPGRIKRMAGTNNYDTWKILQRALSSDTNKVAVIGWNVPDTDDDIKNRFIRFIDDRQDDNIIDKLIISDVKWEDAFADKMSMIFMPRRVEKLVAGFQNDAEKIADLLANQ